MKKERLSIQIFGKTTFYTGLAIGVASAIILKSFKNLASPKTHLHTFRDSVNLFFSYMKEIIRSQTFYADLIMLFPKEFLCYNLFFAAISATVGFGLAIQFWFHGHLSLKLPRRWVEYIRTISIFWIFLLLLLVYRLGIVLVLSLYNMHDYDDELSFYRDLPLLLILLPFVSFLNIWNPIIMKYRVGKWLWISLFSYCMVTVTLGLNSSIDQSHMNEAWKKVNAP